MGNWLHDFFLGQDFQDCDGIKKATKGWIRGFLGNVFKNLLGYPTFYEVSDFGDFDFVDFETML